MNFQNTPGYLVASVKFEFQFGVTWNSGAIVASILAVRSIAGKPLVAVLPFASSGGSAGRCFRESITDDIITDLSKVSGFSVISLDTAFVGKCSATDVKRLARELGVRYVLKGSLRRSGATVRVNVQLIDAASGSYLWADHFDGALENFFAQRIDALLGSLEEMPVAEIN